MARVTGPLMSLGASGSIASTLTYSHWKGRPYTRQLVTPSNPRSAGQYYTRAMMSFLAQAWSYISSPDKASWDTLAKQGNFSAFNAYVKFDMGRWTQLSAPAQQYPPDASSTPDVLGTTTGTGGVRQLTLSQQIVTKNDGWGFAVAIDPANGATPPITLTRRVTTVHGKTDLDVVDTLI